jgi:hypothetical protein
MDYGTVFSNIASACIRPARRSPWRALAAACLGLAVSAQPLIAGAVSPAPATPTAVLEGFESGLMPSGWVLEGSGGVSGAVPGLAPTEGSHFAFINNNGGVSTVFTGVSGATTGSVLTTATFVLGDGETVTAGLNFVTNDGSDFRDFAKVFLLSGGATVGSVYYRDTDSGFNGVEVGPVLGDTFGPTISDHGPGGSNGWGSVSFTPGAGVYQLKFVVSNYGDSSVTSGLAIDNLTGGRYVAPPPAPTGLTAAGGDARVTLTWNAAPGATVYRVRRGTASGGPYSTIASVAGTSWTNTGLTNKTTYYYVVAATNSGGDSLNSAQASATPIARPAMVTDTKAVGGDARVTVTWSPAFGASGYRVRRSTVSGSGPFTNVASVTGTSWIDTSVTNGSRYHYVVAAFNTSGDGVPSGTASATPLGALTGLAAVAGNAKVTLSWNAADGASGYRIRRGTVSGGPYATVATVTGTNWVNTGLSNGTTYYYVVAAMVPAADGPNSAQVSATPH